MSSACVVLQFLMNWGSFFLSVKWENKQNFEAVLYYIHSAFKQLEVRQNRLLSCLLGVWKCGKT